MASWINQRRKLCRFQESERSLAFVMHWIPAVITRVKIICDVKVRINSAINFNQRVNSVANASFRILGAITRTHNFSKSFLLLLLFRSPVPCRVAYRSGFWNCVWSSNNYQKVKRLKYARMYFEYHFGLHNNKLTKYIIRYNHGFFYSIMEIYRSKHIAYVVVQSALQVHLKWTKSLECVHNIF